VALASGVIHFLSGDPFGTKGIPNSRKNNSITREENRHKTLYIMGGHEKKCPARADFGGLCHAQEAGDEAGQSGSNLKHNC
jgi:hypothetical protein